MRLILGWAILLVSIQAQAATEWSELNFSFATAREGGAFMATPDDYIRALSSLDLALLHATSDTLKIEDHLEFLSKQALEWTEGERDLIRGELTQAGQALQALGLKLEFPNKIDLIKTTGQDQFQAHYTRGAAIFFPSQPGKAEITTDAGTTFHELFHILSRAHPEWHDALYSICGFHRFAGVSLPAALAQVALTNPDAFRNEHVVEVRVVAENRSTRVLPVFYSALKQNEVTATFDESKTFKLGLLDVDGPLSAEGNRSLYKTAETDYSQRVLANSHYVIHPEEIMAENFRLLLMKQAGLPLAAPPKHPEALEQLRETLGRLAR